ncbi:MAG: DUF1351 domain-containing protein [Hungatella sp.]
MELKIYNPQDGGFLQKIEWNFEELKTEITTASQEYATSVYNDDSIKSAKADLAKLRKFIDAMETKRKELKKQVLTPYERFELEEKELVGIVQKAIDNIDVQVKDYDRRQREAKMEKVREFYDASINDLEKYLPFDKVFKPEYANASTSMKSIQSEISQFIQKVDEGLAIVNEVDSKFAGDMKAVFLRTYDIGAALAERNRLEADEQRRMEFEAERTRQKAEREARLKSEADLVINAGKCVAPIKSQELPPAPVPQTKTVEDPVHILDFRVYATALQLAELKEFLKNSGIRFEPVPKQ